jgi:hypothetical protein
MDVLERTPNQRVHRPVVPDALTARTQWNPKVTL